MSTGGVFTIITNDGRQDRMLMASNLLKARLDQIAAVRASDPRILDKTPTLLDIEKTHILFTNAHFKPFAAIGFEYNKTQPQSGNASLGSEVTFSIPQFGDFFHDMILHVKLRQPTLTITAADPSDAPLMRWCSYPGERLLETVEFEVNGNPLDKYTDTEMNYFRQFAVQPNKMAGYMQCMGQELPEKGFLDQPNWADSGIASSSITTRTAVESYSGLQTPTGQKEEIVELLIPLLFWCNRDVRLSVPSVSIPYGMRFIKCRLASGDKLVNLVPRGTGTWADSGIGGSLNYDNMLRSIELYINNIFVNPEIHNIFIKRIGFSLIRVHRFQSINCDQSSAEILLQQLKWPIEFLQVGMKLKEYNSSNPVERRRNLDKWDKFAQITDTTRVAQGWRSGKVTVKDDAFALPESVLNNTASATSQLRLINDATLSDGANVFTGLATGDLLTITLTTSNTGLVTNATSVAVSEEATLSLEVSAVIPDGGVEKGYVEFKQTVAYALSFAGIAGAGGIVGLVSATASVSSVASAEASATVPVVTPTIDDVTIKAHGIYIYNQFPSKFYNAYMPYHYGGHNIKTPEGPGPLLISFALYPGSYQPSGHINVSRAREFYLEYNSSVISGSTPGTLYVAASAINFLLISDGSAVLRYST